ncbi:TadE family type IV pilus minor pilin [Oryzobacter telluris]|uniref:TadE family type IV pilus minor pilin n=1 Tax=Oryzobacter telluris TaxID=3149179 RepID=UPI00370DB4D2
MALPALVLVLAVALAAVDLGIAHIRCVDAARTAARLLARGEPEAVAVGEARQAAPAGSDVSVSSGSGRVSVEVSAPVPALLRPLGAVGPPRAVAVARLEDGVDGGAAGDDPREVTADGARGSP